MIRVILASLLLGGCATYDPTMVLVSLAAAHVENNWVAMSDEEKVSYCAECPGCCNSARKKQEVKQIKERN